jgi:tRNA pseudouridine38-40 synthase
MFEDDDWRRHSVSDEVKILSAKPAPDWMENPFSQQDPNQPSKVDWNARFSATQRTYIYRILSFEGMDSEWGVPFEWDRSWRIRGKDAPLNIGEMQQAAKILEGTHDFSSFRGGDCQRQSPIVSMKSIRVQSMPYGPPPFWGIDHAGLLSMGGGTPELSPQLITVSIVGTSFLYRQVRNMVACLVDVGKGKLRPSDVKEILHAKARRQAPGMAPAQGLFLVDVQHGDFEL